MKTRKRQFGTVLCALLLSAVSAVAQNDGSKSRINDAIWDHVYANHALTHKLNEFTSDTGSSFEPNVSHQLKNFHHTGK
jgi:hypothetical protein